MHTTGNYYHLSYGRQNSKAAAPDVYTPDDALTQRWASPEVQSQTRSHSRRSLAGCWDTGGHAMERATRQEPGQLSGLRVSVLQLQGTHFCQQKWTSLGATPASEKLTVLTAILLPTLETPTQRIQPALQTYRLWDKKWLLGATKSMVICYAESKIHLLREHPVQNYRCVCVCVCVCVCEKNTNIYKQKFLA